MDVLDFVGSYPFQDWIGGLGLLSSVCGLEKQTGICGLLLHLPVCFGKLQCRVGIVLEVKGEKAFLPLVSRITAKVCGLKAGVELFYGGLCKGGLPIDGGLSHGVAEKQRIDAGLVFKEGNDLFGALLIEEEIGVRGKKIDVKRMSHVDRSPG